MKRYLYGTAVIFFLIALAITAIDVLSFNTSLYVKHYSLNHTANSIGITEKELSDVTHILLDYLKDRTDVLDVTVEINGDTVSMFNKRERDHMVDVKELYHKALTARMIALVFAAMMALVSLGTNDYKDLPLNRDILRASLLVFSLFLSAVVIFFIVDFNAFWTAFHELVFSNDLWLLDPRTDRLILMVPESFFKSLVSQIAVALISIFIMAWGAYFALDWKVKYDSRSTL